MLGLLSKHVHFCPDSRINFLTIILMLFSCTSHTVDLFNDLIDPNASLAQRAFISHIPDEQDSILDRAQVVLSLFAAS